MIRALMQKLGLDRIGDVFADELKRVQVEVLREEREILARMMEKLDERIRALGGKRRGRPPKAASTVAAPAAAPMRRPRRKKAIARQPGETLQVFVLRAFRKARGPVQVAHLVKRVTQLGYRTGSSPKNLLLRVYHVLADERLFKKLGKGLYALALPGRDGARPKTTTVRKPGESLREMVVKALSKAGGPMKANTLVDLVKEVGYSTDAKRSTLRTSIYHVLADEKLFRRFGPGVYGLVAASAAPPKARKPKRRKKTVARKAPPAAAKGKKAEAAEPAEVKAE